MVPAWVQWFIAELATGESLSEDGDAVVGTFHLLQETGSAILLENGGFILLETAP